MDSILVFDKKRRGWLTEDLTLTEFKCKCRFKSCTRTFVLPATARAFQLTRNIYGEPIRVTSAFRCQRHNERVGGVPNSMHKLGAAIDIRPFKDIFDKDELKRLRIIAETYFDVVLEYEGFLHCHMNYLDDKIPLAEFAN